MARENPGFEILDPDLKIVGGTETDKAAKPANDGMAIAMLTIGLKALSQKALTAATDLFTLITCTGAWWLWYSTPNPTYQQIVSLTIYAMFTLAANWIVRRK